MCSVACCVRDQKDSVKYNGYEEGTECRPFEGERIEGCSSSS
jgi:hypothetical protein